MNGGLQPDLEVLDALFAEEIAALGGVVRDRFADETRLFLRSVLEPGFDVRPGDRMHCGVAMFVCGPDVKVCPFHFRQICRNGAVRSQAFGSTCIRRANEATMPFEAARVEEEVRCAIRAGASPEVSTYTQRELRRAVDAEATHILDMLPMLAWGHGIRNRRVIEVILSSFRRAGDHSVFGLMNAVTATARDSADPEQRRRLEELGGGLPALITRPRRPGPNHADPCQTPRRRTAALAKA